MMQAPTEISQLAIHEKLKLVNSCNQFINAAYQLGLINSVQLNIPRLQAHPLYAQYVSAHNKLPVQLLINQLPQELGHQDLLLNSLSPVDVPYTQIANRAYQVYQTYKILLPALVYAAVTGSPLFYLLYKLPIYAKNSDALLAITGLTRPQVEPVHIQYAQKEHINIGARMLSHILWPKYDSSNGGHEQGPFPLLVKDHLRLFALIEKVYGTRCTNLEKVKLILFSNYNSTYHAYTAAQMEVSNIKNIDFYAYSGPEFLIPIQ